MKNLFKEHEITLKLTEYKLRLLMQIITSSNPYETDEKFVVEIYSQLEEALKKIQEHRE
jgi:uncharacterized protein involved in tolerance to divalent cations